MDVEFAVVGAGAMGLATAWRLALAGREVVLLEKFKVGHDRGSSHGATRIFRFAYEDPLYVKMARAALPMWGELDGDLLRITGGVDVGDREYLEAAESALGSEGAECERLSPSDLRRRFPWLEVAGEEGLYSPDAGVLAANRAIDAMRAALETLGGKIIEDTPVSAIDVESRGAHLKLSTEVVKCRSCVITAGAWTGRLVSPFYGTLPLEVVKQQVFYFTPKEDLIPFIHRGIAIPTYGVTKFGDAPGYKVAEHGTGVVTSADERDFEIDPVATERVAGYVAAHLPGLDSQPLSGETCLYTMTPDEHFVIDVAGPLVLASVCSGHGFKFTPLIGETLARLAMGDSPTIDISRFSAGRFGG